MLQREVMHTLSASTAANYALHCGFDRRIPFGAPARQGQGGEAHRSLQVAGLEKQRRRSGGQVDVLRNVSVVGK